MLTIEKNRMYLANLAACRQIGKTSLLSDWRPDRGIGEYLARINKSREYATMLSKCNNLHSYLQVAVTKAGRQKIEQYGQLLSMNTTYDAVYYNQFFTPEDEPTEENFETSTGLVCIDNVPLYTAVDRYWFEIVSTNKNDHIKFWSTLVEVLT
jgi:hypothetical protein